MKKQSTQEAVTSPQPVPRNADYLAWLRAKSVGAGIMAASVLLGGGLLADAVGNGIAMVPFVALTIVLAVYGVYLWFNVTNTERELWRREVQDGRDYTGDGVLGDPRGHVVSVQGRPAFTLPDLHPEMPPEPPPALIHFPCTANDVLFVLDRAPDAGLGFRAWEGVRLPSGIKLDRATWGAVQDGLLLWQFATARQTATGRRVELRIDVDIEAMKDAVRKGAG